LVSPSEDEGALWINQNAVFAKGFFKSGGTYNYQIKHPGNGAYVFLIEGSIKLDQQLLARRDALGVYDAERFDFEVKEDAQVLVIEVPME